MGHSTLGILAWFGPRSLDFVRVEKIFLASMPEPVLCRSLLRDWPSFLRQFVWQAVASCLPFGDRHCGQSADPLIIGYCFFVGRVMNISKFTFSCSGFSFAVAAVSLVAVWVSVSSCCGEKEPKPYLGISAGAAHTCAVTPAGGVVCWGANASGQLGNDDTSDAHRPVFVTGLGSGVSAVSVGQNHSCALTGVGAVMCWGNNESGQLGDGTNANRTVPVNVKGLDTGIVAVSAGYDHTCALTSGGGVKCWGSGVYGQLGDGTREGKSVPTQVVGLESGVKAVAAGGRHSCAILANSSVSCWGWELNGPPTFDEKLGVVSIQLAPTQVTALESGIVAIVAGNTHSCAVTSDGDARCWGTNEHGELGDETTENKYFASFVQGSATNTLFVTAGPDYSCAILKESTARCWGANGFGVLGDGTTKQTSLFVQVSELETGAVAIAAGGNHACALTSAGGIVCWGKNDHGQLGDGTTNNRGIQGQVMGLPNGLAR